jgi:hypothetical protein
MQFLSPPYPDPYVFGPRGCAFGSVSQSTKIRIRTVPKCHGSATLVSGPPAVGCGVQVHDTAAGALGSCAQLHGQHSVSGAQKDGGTGTSGRRQRTFWPGEGGGGQVAEISVV